MAAAAGGLSKNNKSPPPHSGWRLVIVDLLSVNVTKLKVTDL